MAADQWVVTGVVVHGEKRGRSIGFPTANLHVPAGVELPDDGVYAGLVRVDQASGPSCAAAISVGTNPTFDGQCRTVEAYLLDFDGDLYGRTLEVRSVRRIRGMLRFAHVSELIEAMHADVATARRIVAEVHPSATAAVPQAVSERPTEASAAQPRA